MTKIDFEKDLNQEQYNVVCAPNGSHLVLAGAGSGKTRTLVYRVAWLIQNNVNPEKILLLTFTNKAANEMMERVRKILGLSKNDHLNVWGGTFHSMAHRLLRIYGDKISIKKDFVILDESDAKSIIKNISKEYFHSLPEKRKPSPSLIKEVISFSCNSSSDLKDALELKFPEWSDFLQDFLNISKEYKKRKQESNLFDFDDLLFYFRKLTLDEDTRKIFDKKWEHVLVDEYQDTNAIQAEIVYNLSKTHKNIIAVGDDAQSIYSFRGADINNILDFPKVFKNCRIYKLETNYRSTPEIVSLANNIISDNNYQFSKNLKSVINHGIKPELVALRTNKDEARYITDRIEKFLQDGVLKNEIAVLFRASNHCQQLEMELNARGIEYEMRGGLKFFERAHIKDIVAFLRIYKNINDEVSLHRVLEMYDGIGASTINKIYNELKNVKSLEEIFDIDINLSERARSSWGSFLRTIKAISRVEEKGIFKMIETLIDDYSSYLISQYADYKQRQDDLDQLALFANNYTNLEEFLSEISLQENFILRNKHQNQNNCIVLSTVHQAKGLEWSVVFVMNLVNDSFPHAYATTIEEVEEERRLFYVAITRAKKNLILTYPLALFKYDGFKDTEISEFISCVSKNLIESNYLAKNSSYFFSSKDDNISYQIEDDEANTKEYLPKIEY